MDEWESKRTLLAGMLSIAVPLWIDKLRHQSWEHIILRAKDCSQIVAEKGDIILFKSKKKGETADAFNKLAEGLACLSFAHGGVAIFGCHWEACLDDDGPSRMVDVLKSLVASFQTSLEPSEPKPETKRRKVKKRVKRKRQ